MGNADANQEASRYCDDQQLLPLQVADATQSMMRELQVANGLLLQRLEVLEKLAESAVVADSTADSSQAGTLTMASLLRKVQVRVCLCWYHLYQEQCCTSSEIVTGCLIACMECCVLASFITYCQHVSWCLTQSL